MGDELRLIKKGQSIYGEYNVEHLDEKDFFSDGMRTSLYIECILYNNTLYPIKIKNNKPIIL